MKFANCSRLSKKVHAQNITLLFLPKVAVEFVFYGNFFQKYLFLRDLWFDGFLNEIKKLKSFSFDAHFYRTMLLICSFFSNKEK